MQNTNPATNDQLFAFAAALYRFASVISERSLRELLKDASLRLTSSVARGETEETVGLLKAIDHLMQLAESVRILRGEDVLLIREHAGKFQITINEGEEIKPFASFMQHTTSVAPVQKTIQRQISAQVVHNLPKAATLAPVRSQVTTPAPRTFEAPRFGNSNSGNTMRKEEIMKVIVKKGSARMKDVTESLPNVSERTLRYDIDELIKSGRIERIGNSGPATFYRIPGVAVEAAAPTQRM